MSIQSVTEVLENFLGRSIDRIENGENVVHTGRCRLLSFVLDADNSGAVTIKDGDEVKLALTAGTVKGGQTVTLNALFETGITITLEGENDSGAVTWMY